LVVVNRYQLAPAEAIITPMIIQRRCSVHASTRP
jgi:hypothetical protein